MVRPYADELAAIVAGLDDVDQATLWAAAITARPIDPRLKKPLECLQALRNRVGRAAAEQKKERG
jgi:hypothetical protein